MLILKLGGAAITQKDTAKPTPNLPVIGQIAALLARYPQPLIVVHGAGSYGHGLAKEHQLAHGYHSPTQRPALVQLQLDLLALNRLVVKQLAGVGLPAITLHPASLCMTEGGRIRDFFAGPLRQMLALGMLPVLYGDCVWDSTKTFDILSGDQLVVYLANLLQAERVAFGTNVDGVLDSAGQVIPTMRASDSISTQAGLPHRADVTGGMRGKLDEIAQLTQGQATIFNLQQLDQLEAVLAGRLEVGTRLIF
jgi:isopentenyl phosphate kinase